MNIQEFTNAAEALTDKGWKVEVENSEAYIQAPDSDSLTDEFKDAIRAAGGDVSEDINAVRIRFADLPDLDAETEANLYAALQS